MSTAVYVNQVGYFAAGAKLCVIAGAHDQERQWSLIDAQSNREVASGSLAEAKFDETSGDTVRTADFSTFTTPGTYRLVIGNESSVPFKIGNDTYASLRNDAMAYFYRSRSGIELKPEYARVGSRSLD